MAKYSIGIDFGTLSGRALVVNAETGEELQSFAVDYPHAVMDEALPSGRKLAPDWALQHPRDYLTVLGEAVPTACQLSGINKDDVIGVGIDFTACTLLPVKADGTPLCFLPEFANEPHAYIKLWKHHAAQGQANRLNALARETGEAWLDRYGGKISSEWAIPKILQTLEEAPKVYAAADYFIEAADWVIWQMTGKQTRNACTAGYKAIYHKKEGYPSREFFRRLNPALENVVEDKLNCGISPLGHKAGGLTQKAAALLKLNAGTAVAVANVDAHVTYPAVKAELGDMLAIMGTSTCHILAGDAEYTVPGMCGVVEDGVYPGFFGYEAGQSCVGDHFAWFVKNLLPHEYKEEADARGISPHVLLTEKAAKLAPGESGLVALDWWNGNRSVLVDVDLTGMLIGMTLQTKAEEIYRALLEATAYGTRKIVETFRAAGVPVKSFIASGGIAQKNPFMMQMYADVLRLPIRIAGSAQAPALGSAIFGAVAAGSEAGGYDDVFSAAQRMGKLLDVVYTPSESASAVYDKLYAEYEILHDYFGRGANDAMKRLKGIKRDATDPFYSKENMQYLKSAKEDMEAGRNVHFHELIDVD
ncbi:MAG: ribulokinase [Oscillospiraceae bacterium]|jgi:L-ribulokinase|nr:ribulokinase [Oscillospiraceae bacterium]